MVAGAALCPWPGSSSRQRPIVGKSWHRSAQPFLLAGRRRGSVASGHRSRRGSSGWRRGAVGGHQGARLGCRRGRRWGGGCSNAAGGGQAGEAAAPWPSAEQRMARGAPLLGTMCACVCVRREVGNEGEMGDRSRVCHGGGLSRGEGRLGQWAGRLGRWPSWPGGLFL